MHSNHSSLQKLLTMLHPHWPISTWIPTSSSWKLPFWAYNYNSMLCRSIPVNFEHEKVYTNLWAHLELGEIQPVPYIHNVIGTVHERRTQIYNCVAQSYLSKRHLLVSSIITKLIPASVYSSRYLWFVCRHLRIIAVINFTTETGSTLLIQEPTCIVKWF